MNRTTTLVLVVAIVAALVGWAMYLRQGIAPQVEAPPTRVTPPAAVADVAPRAPEAPPVFSPPAIAEPAPTVAPVPALDQSDGFVLDGLRTRMAAAALERVLVEDAVVRRLVATVDNLGREAVSMKVRALRAAPERFLVTGTDDTLQLDAANFARYRTHVRLMQSLAPSDAADLYVRYYPLLQEAYAELGFPERQFHTRAIDIINQLLATPDVQGPLKLYRPHVLYQFADPELEALSAGQKMLLRAGPANAAAIKTWLRAVRDQIEARQLDPAANQS